MSLKLSQREFSKRIFISQTLYCDIENGNVKPKERVLRLISSQFNINLDFLKEGKGKIFEKSPPDLRLERLIEIFKQFDDETQDEVLKITKLLLKIHKKKDN